MMMDEITWHPRPSTLREEWRFIRLIRRRGFDVVIDVMGNPRSALVFLMSGARHRIAFARWPRSLCYTTLVEHRHELHEYAVEKRLRLLQPLGIQASDTSTVVTYSPEERRADLHLSHESRVYPAMASQSL